jgi:hypothetical protein
MNKWEMYFISKDEVQMSNEEMLNILATKEIQIKTVLRFHLTPVRMAVIKERSSSKYR